MTPHCFQQAIFVAAIWLAAQANSFAVGTRIVQDADADWRFHLDDVSAAKNLSFDDSSWRSLDVPHDWSFENGCARDNAQGSNGGYHGGGIGWYRRVFDMPKAWESRCVRIEFDGVYMNSEVWINGHFLGKRPYGYISFGYDLTPYLQPGRNIIAVCVDNSLEPSTRWYHGCGIYAPVRLVVTDLVHIAPWGVQIMTPKISDQEATVQVCTEISSALTNASQAELVTLLVNPSGAVVATQRSPFAMRSGKNILNQTLTVHSPQRWDPATPRLYTCRSEIVRDGSVGDVVDTDFGIREIHWDAQTGFWLNGCNVKLRGVCEHLEGGPVGAAWPDELIRWKLQLLKNMGCNAIRTAHNPQVPRFYELCDKMGIIVMDEVFDGWRRKAVYDYGQQSFDQWWERDLRACLKRDRNHPSVVIWSVGNETSGKVAPDLVRVCHEMDPSRLVTSGYSAPAFMDVYGVNGDSEKQKFFSSKRPDKPFIATEAPHTWQVRGYYRTQTWYRDGYPNNGQNPFEIPDLTPTEIFSYDWTSPGKEANGKQVFNSSYDNATVRITARQNWELMRDLPWYGGGFRWTGFDYLGESEYVQGGWPFRAFTSGTIDLAGFPKDLYYFYQSQWTDAPMVHLLPGWTHPTMKLGTKIPVWAYSNGDEVQLFLNGQSLGRKIPGRKWNEMQCQWLVPWQPGVLKAVAYRKGKEVAHTTERTAGPATKLEITTNTADFRNNGRDVAIITVALTDAAGTMNPYADNQVTFKVEGPARLLSLENGNPVDTTPNWGVNTRRAFFGLTRAFLQSTRDPGDVSVVMGAILGERNQVTTNLVSIDCQRITLCGPIRPDTWGIFYTLDGTRPGLDSTRYAGSFPVALGTTVKAALFEKGQRLFDMEECFTSSEGLYWEKPLEEKSAAAATDRAEMNSIAGAAK